MNDDDNSFHIIIIAAISALALARTITNDVSATTSLPRTPPPRKREAECDLIPGRRPRLRRPRLLWPEADSDAPNLDRMAREGMRFTQMYAGSTVCAPSRAVLMTAGTWDTSACAATPSGSELTIRRAQRRNHNRPRLQKTWATDGAFRQGASAKSAPKGTRTGWASTNSSASSSDSRHNFYPSWLIQQHRKISTT